MKIYVLISLILGISCSAPVEVNDLANNFNITDSDKAELFYEDKVPPNEQSVFRSMIDSIYSEIRLRKFDTIEQRAIFENLPLEKNRILSIIIAKKGVVKVDLDRITNLYTCICKHSSIKKKNSPDLVIEEYICKNSEDASFWFNKIYNCYYDYKNPIGEPLKEPYKLWQSENRLIHVYTRAEMWRADMDSVNKALMRSFAFSAKTE